MSPGKTYWLTFHWALLVPVESLYLWVLLCTTVFAPSAAKRKTRVTFPDVGRYKPGVLLIQCNTSLWKAQWNPDPSEITVAELSHCWWEIFILSLRHTLFLVLDIVFSLLTPMCILSKELSGTIRRCRGRSVFWWLNTEFGDKSWNNLLRNYLLGNYLTSEKLP